MAAALKKVAVNISSSGDNTLVAGAGNIGGQAARIRVVALFLQAAGTVNAKFTSGNAAAGSNAALTGPIPMSATGAAINAQPMPQTPHAIEGHFETAPGELLNLNLSAPVQVSGWLVYTVVAA